MLELYNERVSLRRQSTSIFLSTQKKESNTRHPRFLYCYRAPKISQAVLGLAYLSKVSSSSWLRSQAIYSSEASVMRGHQDRSRARSFCRFSAINSTPSSVSLLQPDRLSTVRWGNECTAMERNSENVRHIVKIDRTDIIYFKIT